MSGLTAIDILINPDETALEHARRYNARMRPTPRISPCCRARCVPPISTSCMRPSGR